MTTTTTAEGHSDKRSWPRWASRHQPAVPPQADQPTGRDSGADPVGWLAIVSVLLWPVVEAIRIIVQPVHAAALLVGWLVRRRRGFAAALACAPLLAVPLAVVTVHRAGDADYAYVTGWLAFVPTWRWWPWVWGCLRPDPLLRPDLRHRTPDREWHAGRSTPLSCSP